MTVLRPTVVGMDETTRRELGQHFPLSGRTGWGVLTETALSVYDPDHTALARTAAGRTAWPYVPVLGSLLGAGFVVALVVYLSTGAGGTAWWFVAGAVTAVVGWLVNEHLRHRRREKARAAHVREVTAPAHLTTLSKILAVDARAGLPDLAQTMWEAAASPAAAAQALDAVRAHAKAARKAGSRPPRIGDDAASTHTHRTAVVQPGTATTLAQAWHEGVVTALSHARRADDGITLFLEHGDGAPWTNPYAAKADR